MTSENMQTDQPKDGHTPTPWFVSGVRFRMNMQEWISINRYDGVSKRDENIAIVGYDPRTGEGQRDAAFIVTACNAHAGMKEALEELLVFENSPSVTAGALVSSEEAAAWRARKATAFNKARAALRTAEGK